MKKNLTIWTLIALLAAFGAACNDDEKPGGTDDPGEELKPVVAPSNPRVVNLTDLTAILAWDGSSSAYEVEWGGETLPTESTSYGVQGLTPETTYNWKVRSKEGERYSKWVEAQAFTTGELIDYTKGWTGDWAGTDFSLKLTVLGIGTPVESFLPEDVLQQAIEISIKKKEGTIDRILFDMSRLQEISDKFPREVEGRITSNQMSVLSDLKDTLRPKGIEFPLTMDNLPPEIKELVDTVLVEIPLLGEMLEDIEISDMGIVLTGLNLSGELSEEAENQMKVSFSIGGKFHLVTDNTVANTALKILPLTVSMDAKMTLSPKQ